jgi:hypothetical protein
VRLTAERAPGNFPMLLSAVCKRINNLPIAVLRGLSNFGTCDSAVNGPWLEGNRKVRAHHDTLSYRQEHKSPSGSRAPYPNPSFTARDH